MNKTYYENNDKVVVLDEHFKAKVIENTDNVEEKLKLENDIEILNKELKSITMESTISYIKRISIIVISLALGIGLCTTGIPPLILLASLPLAMFIMTSIDTILDIKGSKSMKLRKVVTVKQLEELNEKYEKLLKNSKKKTSTVIEPKLVKNNINKSMLVNRNVLIESFISNKNKILKRPLNYNDLDKDEQELINYLINQELEQKETKKHNKVKTLQK